MRIDRHATIDSTNLEAHRLAAAGETGPLWILAEEQTAGRGRLGRNWVSKPGNLYATLLWPTAASTNAYSQLSFVASVAVAEAASKFSKPESISLKWPNDCLLDGAKFCGILSETLKPGLLAIGIGINVAHVPEGLPYKAARLSEAEVEPLFQALALSLSHWLEIWNTGQGFEQVIAAWQQRCPHIGQHVAVDGEAGIFTALGPDGALLLKTRSGLKHIYAGDVRVEYQPAI